LVLLVGRNEEKMKRSRTWPAFQDGGTWPELAGWLVGWLVGWLAGCYFVKWAISSL